MGRGRITRVVVAGALSAGLALTGCSGERDTGEGRKVEAAVKRFALSHGPDACRMLSGKALSTLYGGRSFDPRVGRAGCLAKSAKFEGQPVDVTFVQFKTPSNAHATARTLDGRRYYNVGLLKSRGRWKIDSVVPAPKPQ